MKGQRCAAVTYLRVAPIVCSEAEGDIAANAPLASGDKATTPAEWRPAMEHLQQTDLSRPTRLHLPSVLHSFSTSGLLVGVIFFAVSLTPSLIPRPHLVQAVISGASLAAGYAIGVFLRWLWRRGVVRYGAYGA